MLGATLGIGNYSGTALGWLGTEETGDVIEVAVLSVQKALNVGRYTDAAGNRLREDGDWGPRTREALNRFNQARMPGEFVYTAPAVGARRIRLARNAVATLASIAPNAGLPATPWTGGTRPPAGPPSGKDFGTPPPGVLPGTPSGSKDGGAPDARDYRWEWGGAPAAGLPRWAWLAIALGGGALVIGGVVVATSGKRRRARAAAAPALAANRRRRRRRR
jgi:hypothetical protein